MFSNLDDFLSCYQGRSNNLLEKSLSNHVIPSIALKQAIHYSLLSGGKRIRPILAYATAQALGEINSTTDSYACALEAIHCYSLIHDDLPAMDDDDLRRGEPSCHIAYGEANAILAGDALQALAFEWIAATSSPSALTAIAILAQAAGASGMVAGQALDMEAVEKPLSLGELETMHRHKTGALIEASVALGALSVTADEAHTIQLQKYAEAIGLAFQVQDDILDVTADTGTLGKTPGADAERNKPTYVSLLGLEGAQKKALSLLDQALSALSPLDDNAQVLRWLAEYIVKRHY